MSAKKARFKARTGWTIGTPACTTITTKRHPADRYRVRMVDARDLTPEKAVENVLQQLSDKWQFHHERLNRLVDHMGMSARVVNGKVRVRKVRVRMVKP